MKNRKFTWTNNRLAEFLKIKIPLIQAPMAGAAMNPALIAAVSNAGGLGSLGAGYLTPDQIRQSIQQIRKCSDQPFAVNLFIPGNYCVTSEEQEKARQAVQACCPELEFEIPPISQPFTPSFEQQMEVILEEQVPVFSFTFGVPNATWIDKFKREGIVLIGTATNLEEAKKLQKHGIDIVVAQGQEAGGHRGTFIGRPEDSLSNTHVLVELFASVIKIPVVAAGGIMDAAGIEKMLSVGAQGVQMGTVFLTCHESDIHPQFKKLLLENKQDKTTLTRAFSGRLARGLNNDFITRMKPYEETILEYPLQNSLTRPMRKRAEQLNRTEFMSMWAGRNGHLCQDVSVVEIIQAVCEQLNPNADRV